MATIFFDYDGTLYDTMQIYGPAWRAGHAKLVEMGADEPREFSDEWISKGLGLNIREMWETRMPHVPEKYWMPVSKFVLNEMNKMVERGEGGLFEGIPEALSQLKADGHTLVFLSNCGVDYMRDHTRAYGLDKWIDYFYCAEDYPGAQKWEIYQHVARDYADNLPRPHIMVGDRKKDMDVAVHSRLSCDGESGTDNINHGNAKNATAEEAIYPRSTCAGVGCLWGYGGAEELTEADVLCKTPSDLPRVVNELVVQMF